MAFVRETDDYDDSIVIDQLHYKINENGVIDTVGERSGIPTNVSFYMSTESDPELQTRDNDRLFGPGEIVVVTGYVKFMTPSQQLQISLHSYDDEDDTTPGSSSSIQFYSNPGLELGLPHPISIIASTEQASAMWVGDECPPNTSLGGLCRNNGGYAGFPPDAQTECFFGVAFDMSADPQRTVYWGDFGEGYMACNQYLNSESPSPGEPICTDPCAHPIHRLFVLMTSDPDPEFTDEDGMQSTLRDVVVGYATCEPNPTYVNPIEDQI